MVNKMKLALALFLAVGMAGLVVSAFAQDEGEQTAANAEIAQPEANAEVAQPAAAAVSGEVVSVDPDNSTVVIKQVTDEMAGLTEDRTISVLPETKITQGDVTLDLSDVKAGDKVTVNYATDDMGNKKVESIAVEAPQEESGN
jgi:hypothetical protein